jgi:hypothetical protein
MTHEEILEKQVEALEKLLQLKQAIMDEQNNKINNLEMNRLYQPLPFQPFNIPKVNVPYIGGVGTQINDFCPIGPSSNHDYPYIWNGTTPPSCSKCGKQASYGSVATTTLTTAVKI